MVKKNYGETVSMSETGNFNVALTYSQLKVMKWLYLADDYKTIARSGTLELPDQLMQDKNIKNIIRIEAMKRFFDALENIMDNTEFGLKDKKDKETIAKLRTRLERLKILLPLVEERSVNARDKKEKVLLHEKPFNLILNKLVIIQREINYPLNNNDMIYLSPPDEFDVDEFMRQTEEDWIHGG